MLIFLLKIGKNIRKKCNVEQLLQFNFCNAVLLLLRRCNSILRDFHAARCAKILSALEFKDDNKSLKNTKKGEDSCLSKNRQQQQRCENEAESESLGLCTLLPSFPWPLESLQLCFAICFLLGAPYTKEVNERAKNDDVGVVHELMLLLEMMHLFSYDST